MGLHATAGLSGHLTGMALPRRYAHLVGSKFTAAARIQGWRQFHVLTLKKGADGYEAELQATCDRAVRVWAQARDLFDRAKWTAGWKLLRELESVSGEPVEGLGPEGGLEGRAEEAEVADAFGADGRRGDEA